jgi:uncharacterized repeat protein (TIGR01451 family)
MKKLYLLILLFIASHSVAQNLVSITPNMGYAGSSLTTTITGPADFMQIGSPPMFSSDVYLTNGTITIIATNFSIYYQNGWCCTPTDSLSADFTLPSNAPTGYYDVHVITYDDPWNPIPFDHLLPSGFFIGTPDGIISGNIYYDINQNGIRDAGEVGVANMRVNVQPSNINVLTNSTGNYYAYQDSGTHTITYVPYFGYALTSTPSSYTITIPPDSAGNDFGVYRPTSTTYTQNFSVWTHPMRCIYYGFSAFTATNNTTGLMEQGSITIIHSPNLSFSYSTIPPDVINGDTLTWYYSNLGPGASFTSQVVYNNPPAGQTVSYMVIDSVEDANGVLMNIYDQTFTTVTSCSVDPNDKAVYPAGENSLNHTLINSHLDYTIRFQNTGTDTAFNVMIHDTLDSDLDFQSVEILSSSDPVALQVDANGAMLFTFSNIMLPDSNVDEPGSNGYVIYRVNPLGGIAENTVINNTAHIIFDFNTPVITNTTMNTMVSIIPVSIQEKNISASLVMYPNPASDKLNIDLAGKRGWLTLYNILGETVKSESLSQGVNKITLKGMSSGIYIVKTVMEDGKILSSRLIIK